MPRNTLTRSHLIAGAGLVLAGSAQAGTTDVLWDLESAPGGGNSSTSMVFSTPFAEDTEVADDFNVTGQIEQLIVGGHGCGQCGQMVVDGVFVRFYEWTDAGPGQLEQEVFVSAASPDFTWDGLNPFGLDITLPEPFQATGWHFVSVQVAFGAGGGYWQFELANEFGGFIGNPVQFRDNLEGGQWAQDSNTFGDLNADVAIALIGTPAPATPIIDTISETTVTPSDRIIVSGSAFGPGGEGELLVNGVPAIVTQWSAAEIIGYIPEGVATGEAQLQVMNLGVASDPTPITVVPRVPDGRISWVFEANGSYSVYAPTTAPDGTTYFDDVQGLLYALSPDGGLMWIADTLQGQQGLADEGPIALGGDGTIYVGSNPLGPTLDLVAFNPDGTHKWTFTVPHGLSWQAGPTVGPDGKIYGAATAGTLLGNDYDVFAINPDGSVAWTTPTNPALLEDAPDGMEIVFGASSPGGDIDQMLFTSDQNGAGRNWGFDMITGDQNFAAPICAGNDVGQGQLASNPSVGDFYMLEFGCGGAGWGLQAFDSDGERTWRFDPGIASGASHPAVDASGDIYFSWDLLRITSVDIAGNERWTVINSEVWYDDPVPSPLGGEFLILGTNTGPGSPPEPGGVSFSFMEARSTQTGALIWAQDVRDDNGDEVAVFSKPSYAPEGERVFFTALGQPITPDSTFRVFSVDTTDAAPPIPGDLDGDGGVDSVDLNLVLGSFGCSGGECTGDADGDGDTDSNDLNTVLGAFGI